MLADDRRRCSRPHARPRPRRARQGLRRGGGPAVSFFPRGADARRRAAEQLARRALAVGPGDRAEDAAGAEARQRRAVDALPHDPGLRSQAGAPAGGLRLLSHRPRRRAARSCAAAGAAWCSATWPRPRAWQGDPRVEVHGPGYSKVVIGPDASADWRALPRRDGVVDRRERRPLLRQRVRRVGDRARARDRRGAGGAARRGSRRAPRTTRRPSSRRSPTPKVARAHLRHDRPRPRGAGREDVTARLRGSGRVAQRGKAAPTCCRRSCCCDSPEHPLANREFLFPFASVVPGAAEEHARAPRPDARGHRASPHDEALLAPLLASPLVDRLNLGPLPDLARQLGPAARGQPVRAPLRPAGAAGPGRRGLDPMRILSLTAGAAGMYCGSCLRDNALAAELMARGHDVLLLPVYTPTRTDEENVSRRPRLLRRHQRLPRAALPAVPQDAGGPRLPLGHARP